MIKYKILLIDDMIFSGDGRRNVFEAFLENKWTNYVKALYDSLKVHNLTEDQMNEILLPLKELNGYFEVDYCDNVTDEHVRRMIKENHYDAVFLDVVFDKGPVETDFEKVLFALKNHLSKIPPIFVYTGSLDKNIITIINTGFNNVFGDITPTRNYLFSEFQKICRLACMENSDLFKVEEMRNVIRRIISKSRGEVDFMPLQQNRISILHISDLQFGDSKTSKSLNGVGNSISSSIGNVDLLVITGDIAMRGIEMEFSEALEFISNLRKKLWPNKSEQERMDCTIVVPGNHDFDLRTTLLNYFKAFNKKDATGKLLRQLDFEKIVETIKENNEKISSRTSFGLQAYREFAYRLTQRKEYLEQSLDFVDTRFISWGVCFYCLNSVGKITAKETNKVVLEQSGDKLFTPFGTLAIALCHHTLLSSAPNEISETDIDAFQKALLGYITGNKCKIIMGGHRHKSSSTYKKLKNDENYLICEASSLRVEGDNAEYIRGYNKYELIKENNIFTKLKETVYAIDESDSSSTFENKEYRIPSY